MKLASGHCGVRPGTGEDSFMFCLDYVLAFVFHSAFTIGAVHLSAEWTRKNGGRITWLPVREDHADLALWTAVTALGLQNQHASKPMQDAFVASSRCGGVSVSYTFDQWKFNRK